MSQTTAPSLSLESPAKQPGNHFLGIGPAAWLQIIIVTALMCLLFRFNLWRLWGKTNPFDGEDSNWQHSVFVPLIGIYYLYIHREELIKAVRAKPRNEKSIRLLAGIGVGALCAGMIQIMAQTEAGAGFSTLLLLGAVLAAGLSLSIIVPRASVLGTVLLLEGLLVFAYGIYPGQNDYIKDMGMILTIAGVVTLLGGWDVMKIAWFPICFLIVAIPWPDQVYSSLAWPLQKIAASAAVGTLRLFGVEAQNFGTKIMMMGSDREPRTLNVAEVCAGLRSLMTFLMVAGTVAFLSSRPLWERLAQTVMAIPIAILCNVVRVAGQGLLDYYVSKELSQNFAHQFVGLIMLIPGFFLILLVGWILDKTFIDEVDPKKLGSRRSRGRRMIVELPRTNEETAGPEAQKPEGDAAERPAGTGNTETLDQAVAEKKAQQPTEVPPPAIPTPATPVSRPAPVPIKPAPPQHPATQSPSPGTRPAPVQSKAPVTQAPPAANPAVAPVASRPGTGGPMPVARPAPTRPAATPASTLKPGTARPAPAAQPAAATSTLKPSSRPVPVRPAPPPSGLKPSTPAGSRPAPPPQGLLPSTARPARPVPPPVAKPAPTPAARPAGAPTKPSVAADTSTVAPPAQPQSGKVPPVAKPAAPHSEDSH